MNSIDDTTRNFTEFINPKTFVNKALEINRLLSMLKSNKTKSQAQQQPQQQAQLRQPPEQCQQIKFTGQCTDIAGITAYADNKMPIEEIGNIENQDLFKSVSTSFSKAKNDGYISMDDNYISLTQKGKEYISSAPFQEQFEKDQINFSLDSLKGADEFVYVEFKGNKDDLEVFNLTESIDLKNINETSGNKIFNYFCKCKDQGFVNISADGIVTPTEQCKKYLNTLKSNNLKMTVVSSGNIKNVTDNLAKQAATKGAAAVSNTVGTIITVTQQALSSVKKAVQVLSNSRTS